MRETANLGSLDCRIGTYLLPALELPLGVAPEWSDFLLLHHFFINACLGGNVPY